MKPQRTSWGSSDSPSSGYERVAADGSRVYICNLCYRIEVSTYEGWLYHLGTREHQVNNVKGRIAMKWRNPPNRPRCVLVKGILGKTSWQMLDFLKMWGQVEDFLYAYVRAENGKTRHCLCLYRDKESADACRNQDGVEWEGINLDIKFQNPVGLSESMSPDDRKARKRRWEESLYNSR